MPVGQVPERFHDILASATLGHLATINEHGRPEVNPVWFLWDGTSILLSVKANTRKYRNLLRDPHIAISFTDLRLPTRYVEIRGNVIAMDRQHDLTFVNELARKHTGTNYAQASADDERYKLTVEVSSWTGQDG
jgi:PPOX class probable F420-dependent enzyme